jgi:hypothetical protein
MPRWKSLKSEWAAKANGSEGSTMKSLCSEYQKQIQKLALGELAVEEEKALKKHLETCSQCRSEQESYTQTIQMLQSVDDEPVPHHFFVYEEDRKPNPWRLFRQMKPLWQTATVAIAGLFFLIGIAAISQVQIRADRDGWTVAFSRGKMDAAAIKEEILKITAERNRAAAQAWMQQIRTEIENSRTDLTRQQREELTAAFARLNSRLSDRILQETDNVRIDTGALVSDMYKTVSQQRARDLALINNRFENTKELGAFKERQTNEILDTLLQVAELKLK